MGNTPPVTFCFPYRAALGGVPWLFSRMARYLAAEHGVETSVVDYRDGYMARAVGENSRVRVVEFRRGQPVVVPDETVLVLQSVLPYKIWPEIRPGRNTRLLFWTLHPLCWVPTLLPFPWAFHFQARYPAVSRQIISALLGGLRSEIQILLEQLIQTRSVLFMDGATLRTTTELVGVRIEVPEFVPLPCDMLPANAREAAGRASREGIAFGYLGRLADFKMSVLTYTMRRLAEYAARTRTPAVMHVIGEGPLAGALDRVPADPRWFEVRRAGVLTGEALDAYLLEHVDVLVAMGHSALQGGRLGIPTILLDVFYGRVPPVYRFRWLFESREYVMGEMVAPEGGVHSIDEIVEAARERGQELSERTYRYCEGHAFTRVAERLFSAIREASFRYGDLRPGIVRKSPTRRGYEFLRDAARAAK